jgi:hypothetical protein
MSISDYEKYLNLISVFPHIDLDLHHLLVESNSIFLEISTMVNCNTKDLEEEKDPSENKSVFQSHKAHARILLHNIVFIN